MKTDEKGRVALGALPGIANVGARIPNGRQSSWDLDDFERTWPAVLHAHAGDAIKIPAGASTNAANVSLLALRAGTFVTDHSAGIEVKDGFIEIKELAAGDYSLRLRGENRDIAIKVTAGKLSNGWFLGASRNLEAKSAAPLQITSVATEAEAITVKLANTTAFTRVHVAASRFEPGRGIFADFGNFTRFGAASGAPSRLPNLYAAGREIGDEYRYILDRRYQKLFPGNMLARPGLLLNPWDKRSTEVEELAQQAGEAAGVTRGGKGGALRRAMEEKGQKQAAGPGGAVAETNLDFLAAAAPAIYNLLPDKDGVVRIDRKALGDRQHVQIYAEDLTNAVWRSFALPEAGTKFSDLRLTRNLDPAKPFTQKKEITVVEPGRTLTLADILTSEFETYDTLGGVFSLLTTLNGDATLAKFAWVLEWPKLKDEEKRAKYSEFACHELNLFLAKKDHAFFEKVIQPYLRNKKDRTFMDDFLLGNDLAPYLQPWAYGRLNVVERALLAPRIGGESPGAARHLRELWEMIPPNPDEQDRLFETALRGRALQAETGEMGNFKREKAKEMDRLERAAESKAAAAPHPMNAPMAPAAAAPGGGFGANAARLRDGKDRARQLGMKDDQLAADRPMEALQEARKMLKGEAPAR
ncbi:MAG TPA: hypothetical protein VK643_01845, partial [Burkholderiales bacterium]|nr:hypothetical protein [Burkholderiales bacterium]